MACLKCFKVVLHDDEISDVVHNDFCLLRFAESLYSKHGNDASMHDYTHQKTRQLGHFLHFAQKVLNPNSRGCYSNFMKVIEAVKEKIGHSLLKVSDIIRCHALMAGDEDLIKSSEAFQKLYQAKWSEYISHCALSTISDLKYNKPDNLPLTEDIQKLH